MLTLTTTVMTTGVLMIQKYAGVSWVFQQLQFIYLFIHELNILINQILL